MGSLGNVLKQRRLALGYSLREAAEKAGVSNPYLSQLETHKITKPSPSVLKKLSELYSVSYPRLLGLAGHPAPNLSSRPIFFRASSGTEELTKEEEKELLNYLKFIRTRGSK